MVVDGHADTIFDPEQRLPSKAEPPEKTAASWLPAAVEGSALPFRKQPARRILSSASTTEVEADTG